MFARMLCGLGAAALLATAASAQMVEDYEHNDEVRYTFELTAVDNFDVTAAGAHNGARGGTFQPILNPAFRLRSDVRTAPGNTYEWFVRNRGALGGRSYFGVGAVAGGGAWSGIFAPNTNQILLQNNLGWGFVTAGSAAFVPTANTWYRMRLVWAANGDMTLSIHNQSGSTTLASIATVATGFLTPGGIAVRGFGTDATTFHDIDTFAQHCDVETMEHGDEALYALATAGDNLSFVAAAARHGSLGAEFGSGASGFRFRSDITTGPGTTYEWFVRTRGGSDGRSYVGFGATLAGGAWSGVFAPNTGEIIIQNNTAWGFVNATAAPFIPAVNTWYRMRLVWASNGDMTLAVLNDAGTAVLASTGIFNSGFTTGGGLSMRGFGTVSVQDVDSLIRKPMVDDLEHGNELLYALATAGDNMTLNAAAAHASDFGAEFTTGGSGFRLRSDVGTAPGNIYQWMVRSRGSATAGRSYVGVGASAAGAFSGVFAPNTGNIIIQNNTAWGFVDVASAPFVPAADTWYMMRLRWDGNGGMQLSILDATGATSLASTGLVSTGYTTAGGLSMRGFSTSAGAFQDVDSVGLRCDIPNVPPPFNYCTAKTSSSGCVPAIGFTGVPSPTGNYVVTCSQVEVGQLGVLFYGTSGPAAAPFQGGFLCVSPGVTRLPVQGSGGAAACTGSYTQAMTGVVNILAPGQQVNCQWWFRDPGAASGTGLSNANQFVVTQ